MKKCADCHRDLQFLLHTGRQNGTFVIYYTVGNSQSRFALGLEDVLDFLIFSDSHGKSDAMQSVLDRQIRTPDAVFFLGDGLRDTEWLDMNGADLYDVRGNCDWFGGGDTPDERTLCFEGHKIFLTHGHAYGVKGGVGALLAHAAQMDADIVLFGHTHTPLCQALPIGETVGGMVLTRPLYLFNPGSLGAGSFGTLTLRGETVLFSHGTV